MYYSQKQTLYSCTVHIRQMTKPANLPKFSPHNEYSKISQSTNEKSKKILFSKYFL